MTLLPPAASQDNPGVLEKLREEQQKMTSKHGDRITGPILKEMVYADAVIRETLRIHNVVSGLTRSAAKDFELGGYRLVAVRCRQHNMFC